MNRQELIEKIENEKFIKNNTDFEIGYNLASNTILRYIEHLDEPEKVTIPQFVADYIEWTKGEDFHLLGAMNRENFDNKLEDWFYTDDNMELFARAWLDGYEVEEEKRYLVKMKGVEKCSSYLKLNKKSNRWYFGENFSSVIAKELKISHTRKELEEAGFGWVFDCPGIEIEEVTG